MENLNNSSFLGEAGGSLRSVLPSIRRMGSISFEKLNTFTLEGSTLTLSIFIPANSDDWEDIMHGGYDLPPKLIKKIGDPMNYSEDLVNHRLNSSWKFSYHDVVDFGGPDIFYSIFAKGGERDWVDIFCRAYAMYPEKEGDPYTFLLHIPEGLHESKIPGMDVLADTISSAFGSSPSSSFDYDCRIYSWEISESVNSKLEDLGFDEGGYLP